MTNNFTDEEIYRLLQNPFFLHSALLKAMPKTHDKEIYELQRALFQLIPQAIRRDEVLEALGLRAKVGDNQFKGGEINSPPLKTTTAIAKEIGISERVLQQNKQLARSLTPEVKETVRKHDIPKTDALKLARMEPEKQRAVAIVKQWPINGLGVSL